MMGYEDRLRFIGEDGSMGLKAGQIYEVKVFTGNGYLWVKWKPQAPFPTSGAAPCACPYSTLRAFANNWELPKKGEA